MLISRGSLTTFIDRPISTTFVALSVILLVVQAYLALRRTKPPIVVPEEAFD